MSTETNTAAFFHNIAGGRPWQLQAVDTATYMEPDELQRRVERKLDKYLHANRAWWKLGITELAVDGMVEDYALGGIDYMVEKHPRTMARIARAIMEPVFEKLEGTASALARRGFYLPAPTLRIAITKNQEKLSWRFDPNLEPSGLLHHSLAHRGLLPGGVPVGIRLLNEIKWTEGKIMMKGDPDPEEWELFRKLGYLVRKGNMAIFWDGHVRETVLKAFPDPISCNSYVQRLFSPLVPGGFHAEKKVFFSEARITKAGKTVFCTHPEWETAAPSGRDGAHAHVVEELGDASLQFTWWNLNGVFTKGISEPVYRDDALLPDGVTMILDPNQIKGAWKGKFTNGDTLTGDIGVMRKYAGGRYPWAFEGLQWMIPSLHEKGRDGFVEDITSIMEDAADKKFEGGVSGIFERKCREDDRLRAVGEVLKKLPGSPNPLAVPYVRDILSDALRKDLWHLSQGGGGEGEQHEILIDRTLKPGQCVITGYKPGMEVAVWRFPTVLAQGLRVLTTVAPDERMCPVGRIYMSEFDTKAMQADDDGDIVGVSADPRYIRLFRCVPSKKVYAIEPKGEKISFPLESDEGFAYMAKDPRGPVGLVTIAQARVLSMIQKDTRALWYGLALAVLTQYTIDVAKRAVVWPNLDDLSNPHNWVKGEDGFYRAENIRPAVRDQVVVMEDGTTKVSLMDYPREVYQKWLKRIYKRLGIIEEVVDPFSGTTYDVQREALAWRSQTGNDGQPLAKRVNWTTWESCRTKAPDFKGGNVVHATHDAARRMFKARVKDMVKCEDIELRELVPLALKNKGVSWRTRYENWYEYERDVRRIAGIESYSNQMSSVLSGSGGGEDKDQIRSARLEMLEEEFQAGLLSLDLDELLEVWWWENTTMTYTSENGRRVVFEGEGGEWPLNKPHIAIRLLTNPNSRLMAALGVAEDLRCPWTAAVSKKKGDRTLVTRFAEEVLGGSNPWETLAKRIHLNTSHGDMVRDENGERVELRSCPACQKLIVGTAMSIYRQGKTVEEAQFMKTFTTELNQGRDRPWKGKVDKNEDEIEADGLDFDESVW